MTQPDSDCVDGVIVDCLAPASLRYTHDSAASHSTRTSRFQLLVVLESASGQGFRLGRITRRRDAQGSAVTQRCQTVLPRTSSTLGTFYPTPVITVQAIYPIGGGYSPLGISGDQELALYGPFSPFRTTTAPVLTYVRGYDGQIRVDGSTRVSDAQSSRLCRRSLSDRGQQLLTVQGSAERLPSWSSAINWIDQN